jgi:hypothetical protein
VVHDDHVYLPSLQPRVQASTVGLTLEDGTEIALMRDGRYLVSFDGPAL